MYTLVASIVSLVVVVVGGVALLQYWRFRGDRFVRCPENDAVVPVAVDAAGAAWMAMIGHPELHLRECARWPDKQGCGQECLRQIEQAPADCLVRNIVARWYEERSCLVCHRAIGPVHWHDHPPALLDDDGRTVEWKDVPLARLPEFLETHKPVCWNCHVVQTFRREHPELVIVRRER